MKFTVREANSSGFGGTALAPGIGMQDNESSAPFGLTQVQWGADGMARSQRLDWTVVNLKDFGVTAFGYQNEVGRDFQPFGQTKSEFAMAGISTMKAGGQVRVGPFGFGFAQSSLENAGPVTNLAAVQQGATNLAAVQQEASVTLDLAHLLSGTQVSSGLFSKLLPTFWVTRSDKHTPTAGQEAVPRDAITSSFGAPTIWVTGKTVPRDVITSSLGGTWKWDIGEASLNYWSYRSDGSESVTASTWAGHGFNANFGAYYSSFGIDADLSYGQSENVARSIAVSQRRV